MSCWDTLGIDRTDDATVIKRAYAARLKHTKPDEDPAGFSRLHAAYKQALVTAKRASPARRQDQEPRTSARVSQIQTPEPLSEPSPIAEMSIPELAPPLQPMLTEWAQTSLAKQEPIAQPPHPTGQRADRETEHDSAIREPVAEKTAAPDRELISGQELAIIDQDEEDPQVAWDRLTEAVDALLLDIDRANRIESWQFIDGEHVLYDIQFKPEFSRFLFLRLRDLPEIKQPVIPYLNQMFRSTDQSDDLNSRRGKVQGVTPQASGQNIKALVPMAEMLSYAPTLNSLTSGRGMYTMEFYGYQDVPSHLSQKIVQERHAAQGQGHAANHGKEK